jgi:transcriptional regulator with XRE-family HTH domain
MVEIGASLREARTRRGLSPEDVRRRLRIRERYLTALEQERWELLPGEAYAKGFLRTYAEFLGLNGTLYIDEYNERFAVRVEEPFVPESLTARGRRSRLLTRTVAGVLAVGAIVVASTAWRPASSARPGVAVAEAATPQPSLSRRLPVALVDLPAAPAAPKIALIRAVETESWLSVRLGGPNGRELFRGFLNRGHRLRYRLDRSVWLRIGRPQALTIRIGKRLVNGLPGTPVNLLLTARGPLAG